MHNIKNSKLAGATIEFEFMCELLAEDRVTDQEIREKYNDGVIDWKEFNRLILHHRVYLLIYTRLLSLRDVVPVHVMEQLQKAVTTNTFYMMKLTAEMGRVITVLEDQDIHAIMLKGPVLAYELYGDLAHRTSKDLDVLVDVNDVEAALLALERAGYNKKYDTPFIMDGWKWKDHHISMFHPQLKTQVEIHWKLNPSGAKDVTFEELWSRKQVIALAGHEVSYLGKEDLFMYLISHGARHGWFRLRWLMDIDLILRKHTKLENFEYYAEVHESKFYVGQAYYLCSKLLGAPLTTDMKELAQHSQSVKLAEYALNMIFEEPDEKTGIQYLKQIKSPKRRIIMLLGRLYPGPQDAALLPLPRKLHFLYVPLRPFLWTWRRVRQRVLIKGRHEYD